MESLSAVLNASGHTFYAGDDINDIKPYLTVTATYSDSTTATVPSGSYTLSGSLVTGENTITVSYEGVSTTVTVTAVASVLTSISAVYTQSGTVYTSDSLDSLKSDLGVTAHYSDSSTSVVSSTDYTLSGTLTVGTSTITVTYEGLTTTFNVTATDILYSLYNHTFSNADPIATGLTLLTSDRDITFAFDVDFAGQQSNTIWKLFAMINGSGAYEGLAIQAYSNNSTDMQIQNMTNKQRITTTDMRNYVGNFKYICTHTAGSGQWDFRYKIGNSSVVAQTVTSAFVSITGQLTIGGTASASQVFNGTINSAEVYNRVLSASEISAFIGE